MQKRTLKVAILAALTIVLVFSMSAAAFAQPSQYSDLNGATVGPYKVTLEQVSAIADVESGKFRPYADITRAEFAVMAVKAFDIPLVNPATPSFPDVPATHALYQYIEAAYKAGIIQGYTDGKFGPADTATRQQMLSIIARYVGGKAGYYAAGVWNFRTPAEIDALVAHFGDAASIDPAHKTAMAFSYAMGITLGNAQGNLAPLSKTMRLQAAAMLIRSTELVPFNAVYPANVVQITADKSENLIGKTHTLKFKVTDAAGHPAKGALVDFDTMYANPLYVGNISPQAALTDAFGEVSVNLYSAEPGTQRVTATVQTITGPATTVATKYWVALDEVYILDETRVAENNAGDAHEWCARVVVIGPGPRSTSQFDWYNVIDASYDPTDLQTDDGVWKSVDNYNEELALLDADESMRTMAGIGVEWTVTWNPTTMAGSIVSKDDVTDADGVACITIKSTSTGTATVQAMAWYAENPYPQMLLDRDTADPEDWEADDDWEQQPKAVASATKTWIPHVIGGDSDGPITPAYAVNNTGEVETFTLELKDVYGNVIPGYTVEWWIQGVGFFKTDDSSWAGVGETNRDWDVTDAAGKSSVWVKSLVPGQTIVHCKVTDKYGLPYKEWNVVKQWYSIDDVQFGLFDTDGDFVADNYEENAVATGHDWVVAVTGAKYVHVLYDINVNGLMDDQALLTDKAELAAYDATNSLWVAKMVNNQLQWVDNAGAAIQPGMVYTPTVQGGARYTSYAHLTLSGAEFMIDMNDDSIDEVWSGLAGKTVYFYTNIGDSLVPVSNTPLAVQHGTAASPKYVGTITSATPVVTDEDGFADVTINSTMKGYQYTYAVADYTDNPQDGDPLKPFDSPTVAGDGWQELRSDMATKLWKASTEDSVKIFAAGDTVASDRWVNPILTSVRGTDTGLIAEATNPNKETIAVQVFDAYGNALPGYKVTWEVVGQGTTTAGAKPTYHPYAHLYNPAHPVAGVGDLNPFWNSNLRWGTFADGVHPDYAHDPADADYAWGLTQDFEIDFTLNLVSAAHVDLVLDETLAELGRFTNTHFTNIVNIKIYRPDGTFWKQYEVTKVWEAPVPASITIDPAADYAIAGVEDQSVVATVLDQFSNPVVGANIGFVAQMLEGSGLTVGDVNIAEVTGADGKVTFTWAESAGEWGVQTIYAFWDVDNDGVKDAAETLVSTSSTIQWIYDDRSGAVGPGLDLVQAYTGEQKVYVSAANPLWPTYALTTHLNPGAAAIGGPVTYTGVATSMSTGAKTWALDEPFFVKSNSSNTDNVPNWVYDLVVAPAAPIVP